MRILHTGDWHLGFRLGRHGRRADTTAALKTLVGHAERTRPHAILHAGDVFHHERPPQSAIEDAVQALKALADYAPVIIAAGNHDGPRLLESLDRLAQEGDPQRIMIATRARTFTLDLSNRDDAPPLAVIAAVPWLSRGDGAAAWAATGMPADDPGRPTHAQWAGTVIRETIDEARREAEQITRYGRDAPPPVVALIHTHLAGAVASNAEREIAVSREYAVDPGAIPPTGYCACGHIHDRQEIGGSAGANDSMATPIVYCGSLIQMTFGEKAQQKTTELVELQRDTRNNAAGDGSAWRTARADRLPLDAERRLVEHEGSWADLKAAAADGALKDAILKARVVSDDRIHDLASMVRELEPGIVIHELRNPVTNPEKLAAREIAFEDRPEPPIDELYEEWRRDRQGEEREADDGAVELFKTALQAVREPTDDPFGIKRLEERFEAIAARLRANSPTAAAAPADAARPDAERPASGEIAPPDGNAREQPPETAGDGGAVGGQPAAR